MYLLVPLPILVCSSSTSLVTSSLRLPRRLEPLQGGLSSTLCMFTFFLLSACVLSADVSLRLRADVPCHHLFSILTILSMTPRLVLIRSGSFIWVDALFQTGTNIACHTLISPVLVNQWIYVSRVASIFISTQFPNSVPLDTAACNY